MAEFNPTNEEHIEAYLEGRLSDEMRREAENMLESNKAFAEQVELQQRIERCLRQRYSPPAALDIVPEKLTSMPPKVVDQPGSGREGRLRKVRLLALAASIAWIAVAYHLLAPQREEVAFQPRPLVDVYQTCVDEGFQPYWVCDDDFLFAATFQRRQDVPLELAPLPEGTKMVGLSYLAGLSRKSTSMLAFVDDRPVVVIVDKLERDWAPETGTFGERGLYVFRKEKFGLVFYEVTPFEKPVVVDYLKRSQIDVRLE